MKEKKILVKEKKENHSPLEEKFHRHVASKNILLLRQYPVGKYFLDFAYFDNKSSNPKFKIAIEIDGLKYHSYINQRENDYERQYFLMMNDWYVLRFTGRQVYKNSKKCIKMLLNYIEHLEKKYYEKNTN